MADNVTISEGSGKTIAADDVSNVFYQIIKIAVGADGSATFLDGNSGNKSAGTLRVVLATDQPTMSNAQPVTPAATEAHLGEVGGKVVRVTGTFTRPADTTAYAANDVVSNNTSTTTLITLSNAARVNAGSGYIVGARVATDKKSITPRIRVHLWNASTPTVSADNANHKSVYADISKRIGTFDLAAMATSADTTNSDMSSTADWTLRIPFVCAAASTTLYAFLETMDAFTPSSGQGFTLELMIDQN